MANTNYIKCEKVEIEIAGISLPCWVSIDDPEQRFLSGRNITDAVGKHHSSLARLLGVKTLKALSDKGFQWRNNTKIAPQKGEGSPFDPISIPTAFEYWAKEIQSGNQLALALVIACGSETLDRRIDTALGLKRSEDEYEARTKLRRERILARLSWTDQIKLRQEHHGYYRDEDGKVSAKASEEYKKLTIKVNLVLFGQPHFACNRDNMTLEQQSTIHAFETFMARWGAKYPDKEATVLVQDCLDLFNVR